MAAVSGGTAPAQPGAGGEAPGSLSQEEIKNDASDLSQKRSDEDLRLG